MLCFELVSLVHVFVELGEGEDVVEPAVEDPEQGHLVTWSQAGDYTENLVSHQLQIGKTSPNRAPGP